MICGNCTHWKREKPYTWGVCTVPLPVWVYDEERGGSSLTLFSEDARAKDCDVFEKAGSQPRAHHQHERRREG